MYRKAWPVKVQQNTVEETIPSAIFPRSVKVTRCEGNTLWERKFSRDVYFIHELNWISISIGMPQRMGRTSPVGRIKRSYPRRVLEELELVWLSLEFWKFAVIDGTPFRMLLCVREKPAVKEERKKRLPWIPVRHLPTSFLHTSRVRRGEECGRDIDLRTECTTKSREFVNPPHDGVM